MNTKRYSNHPLLTGFTVSLLSMTISSVVHAQDDNAAPSIVAPPILEEMIVQGRLQTGAQSVVMERMQEAVAADLIGSEQIGRVGDSTVAIALTRVPGVTLVDDKFVFVRGLGERYSSTSLNGAMVPSPDLSRNVLPLDIFPTSIVESLSIQKAPSANKPAAFGGGSVDIRTKGIPNEFVFTVEVGTGMNTESSEFLTYKGGSDDRWGKDDGSRELSPTIENALDTYRGDFTPANINTIGDLGSIADASEINRNLALDLNREISLRETNGEPDIEGEINIGNKYYLPNEMEIGFLAGVAYDSKWRSSEITQRKLGNPEEQVLFEDESVYSVDLTGNFSLGLVLNSENKIETTSIFLRNTDDEVSVADYFSANNLLSDGDGNRNSDIRYEQREMEIHQLHGEHEFGWDTIDSLGLEKLSFLEGLSVNWYISDSEATTEVPNEVRIKSRIVADPATGEALSSRVETSNNSAGSFRFTHLRDNVESRGISVTMPFELADFSIKVQGGTDYWQKARTYEQLEFFLGSTTGANPSIYDGPLGDVFSDENIANADNGFLIATNGGNANSYIAANKVNAAFGNLDVTWKETLRVVVGSRWEDYQQLNLPWDPIKYDGSQFPGADSNDPDEVADYFLNATYTDDDFYNSIAVTWMVQDFWAEDFQLRASFGETTVRPDLREISDSSYFDPITDIAVDGNSDVLPSQMDNYDLRAEWFFSNGDNFTVSLFYKDIVNPIELFEGAATDDNITAEIHNAESAEVAGVELEFLKNLGDVAEVLDPFFIQGNFTFLDQELVAGDNADAPTNEIRPLQGASDQVTNLIFGFDSPDGMHAATLSYNVFSERLFFAGRNGAPDSYEQPFHSLDFTYSFYPLDSLTVKFKAKNLLDQDLSIEARNEESGNAQTVEIYNAKRGQDLSLSVQYKF
jgi:hypothetical protein